MIMVVDTGKDSKMNSTNVSYPILAIAAGLGIPVMARLNATLAASVRSDAWAALVLFAVAAAGVGLLLLATRQMVPPGWSVAPKISLFAGLLVAFYLLSVTYLIPRLGVSKTILAVLLGQIVSAVLIDQFGLLGAVAKPFELARLAGVGLMVAGLAVVLQ